MIVNLGAPFDFPPPAPPVRRVGEELPPSGGAPPTTRPTRPRPIRWPERLRALRPAAKDALLAVLVAAVALTSLVARLPQVLESDSEDVHFLQPDVLGIGLVLVSCLPIAWRHRAPLTVLLITTVGTLAYQELGYAPAPLPYGPLLALHALAIVWRPPRSAAVAVVLVAVIVPLLYLTLRSPVPDDEFIAYALAIGVAWGLGYGVQLSRARARLLEGRAVQLAREREIAARLAVQQDRARIARDLHDIVSHHVSVMVAQATAVPRFLEVDPEKVRQALLAIETVGRRAMVEMRRMLAVLQPGSTDVEGAVRPGLDQLGPLLDDAGRDGITVELVVTGRIRALPATVETNAYLILAEALANVVRHADGARAEVLIGYRSESLSLTVRDHGGSSRGPADAGHGLVGIVQRVTALRGHLAFGPLAAGGFELAAELPVTGSPG